jgi:hypothetical protein
MFSTFLKFALGLYALHTVSAQSPPNFTPAISNHLTVTYGTADINPAGITVPASGQSCTPIHIIFALTGTFCNRAARSTKPRPSRHSHRHLRRHNARLQRLAPRPHSPQHHPPPLARRRSLLPQRHHNPNIPPRRNSSILPTGPTLRPDTHLRPLSIPRARQVRDPGRLRPVLRKSVRFSPQPHWLQSHAFCGGDGPE